MHRLSTIAPGKTHRKHHKTGVEYAQHSLIPKAEGMVAEKSRAGRFAKMAAELETVQY